jgi:NAD(P)-dependent dehydrogenase (short-subunit alcohol dehydrogenase family)
VDSFEGRIAVVTGGGSGMGRELVVQLAAEGCSVATCDLEVSRLGDTVERALAAAPPSSGVRVTAHACDVSDAAQVQRFRDEVVEQHRTDHVHLVFNNAGIGGGGSFVTGSQEEWERVFGVCWGGVYNGCRAFLPLLVAADAGYLVNTSSVNGFWASLGPGVPHTAYSSAKFAVKGFSEALIEDLRIHAPHVQVAVVMPGHVGTDIVLNSRRVHGSEVDVEAARADMARRGFDPSALTDDQVRDLIDSFGEAFRDNAPLSAADAATLILDGVRAGRWRILVGDDAAALDAAVRADPEAVYGADGFSLQSVLGGQ